MALKEKSSTPRKIVNRSAFHLQQRDAAKCDTLPILGYYDLHPVARLLKIAHSYE